MVAPIEGGADGPCSPWGSVRTVGGKVNKQRRPRPCAQCSHCPLLSFTLPCVPSLRFLRTSKGRVSRSTGALTTYNKGGSPMSVSLRRSAVSVCLLVASLLPTEARAQNWSFDARAVGLGGVGSTSNVAVDMVDEQRPYRAIVLPFGLLQVIPNLPKLESDQGRVESRPRNGIQREPDSLHHRARRYGDRLCFPHRPSEWRARPRSQRLSGIFAGDERVSRRSGVAELGAHVQAESEHQRVIPRNLRGRRAVPFDADVGRDRSCAGSRVCEFDAGVYTEHQLLHVERHTQVSSRWQ